MSHKIYWKMKEWNIVPRIFLSFEFDLNAAHKKYALQLAIKISGADVQPATQIVLKLNKIFQKSYYLNNHHPKAIYRYIYTGWMYFQRQLKNGCIQSWIYELSFFCTNV